MPRCLLILLCWSSLAVADDLVIVGDREWCGACQRLHADLARHPEAVVGHTVTWSDGRAANWRVRQVPTIIRLRDGREIDRQVGYRGLAHFQRWLRP